jgi:Tol biopolymer transport system component
MPANGDTLYDVTISPDGRFVAFGSLASNLVVGDTNGVADVFVYDRETGATSLVSIASDGTPGDSASFVHSLSADGRFVAFTSVASNLVPNDTNFCIDAPNCPDIFLHDRQTGKTTRLSLSPNGVPLDMYFANPVLSADGQIVVFETRGGPFDPDASEKMGNLYYYSVFVRSTACLNSSTTAAPQRNGFWNSTTLTWNPVSWATNYHIQVATDSAFQTLVEDETVSASTLSLPLTNPARVTHYWRVQAKKPDGSWGSWSAVETFVIR